MADQSHLFLDGVAKDVPVRIHDHYIPMDFFVLDMGEEEHDPPLILGRPFLNTTQATICIPRGEVHFKFTTEKVCCYFNNYNDYQKPKKNRSRRRRAAKKKQILNAEKQEVNGVNEEVKDEEEKPTTPERLPTADAPEE
jgi:hypothetical protein